MKAGWITTPLSQLCDIKHGFAFKSEFFTGSGDHVLLTPGNFHESGGYRDRGDKQKYYSGEIPDGFVLSEGDLLVAMTEQAAGLLGSPILVPESGNFLHNQRLGLVTKKAGAAWTNEFFFHVFNSDAVRKAIHDSATGVKVRHTSPSKIGEVIVTIPASLAEQRRIVGILDEAFEGLATAKANAEQNLQNARALFESHLQAVFTQRGHGWVEKTLGEEIDLLAGFAFKSAQYTNRDQDVRLLRGDNIIQGCLRWDDVKKWPANDVDAYESYQLREGDVVLAMDRPWVKAGLKHATISPDDLPCLLVQRTARLRGSAKLNNRFLMYLIGSAAFTRHILGVQTGIGVPHISGQQIKDFEFVLPPEAEQRRIADNLETLREETQRLESLYQRKLAALDELKKSLLHRAFSGQL